MSYTAGVFYLDPVGGSDTARTVLTTVTAANPSGTITRLTKVAHGLVTGAVVDLTLFSAWLNDAWKITVVDVDNFDLDGAVWQTTADNNGTATPRGGSSKADAWKTRASGATSARHQAGDTIREIASLDPTSMGQSGTWTNLSKTVTLTTAVTADIETCETAWTASSNVVTTTNSLARREGALCTSIAPNATFTTGLAAYKAMSSTDFSAYQQVSFWFQSSVAFTAGQVVLKLCSDNAGVTAQNTLNLPAYPVAGAWTAITIDNAGALYTAVQSVALYVGTDFGAFTALLDNIIACKASASADSLSLTSLIGKVWNLNWAASTTYAANDIRKPTSPNRNGFRFKVTAGGGGSSGSTEPTWPNEVGVTVTDGALTWTCDSIEETWYPIQSIRGTTVLLDNDPGTTIANAGRGYHGATETVATYKREPTLLTAVTVKNGLLGAIQRSGTVAGGQITYSGGWNRTDMTTQTGETWLSGQSSAGSGVMFLFNDKNFITVSNLNATRCGDAWHSGTVSTQNNRLVNCHASGLTNGMFGGPSSAFDVSGVVVANSVLGLTNNNANTVSLTGRCLGLFSNSSGGTSYGNTGLNCAFDVGFVEAKNNAAYGLDLQGFRPKYVRNLITSDNATGSITVGNGTTTSAGGAYIGNATISESTVVNTIATYSGGVLYINNLNGVGAKSYHDGGTIAQATDQRNTASGYSWKFLPTSTTRSTDYPLKLSVAKVACNANALVTLGIYVRRDSTQIAGRLMVKGGQVAGVGLDAYTTTTPSINTWTQSTLTFTPTAAGVVEVIFECYDGVGTTNSLWIDDFSASQA